ncbi:MAG: hypothetical protein KKD74_03330 [Bacteroidetes bacterium]|nr:hypothetical protein [Bacteroidales bacterium]MBU1009149.1 hypothetical protein [Bacteroidota bacterium]
MKKSLLLLSLIIGLGLFASAQENKEYRTLFGRDGDIDHGAYGAMTFSFGSVDGKDAFMTGIKGGWVIDHRLTLGLAGSGFTSDLRFDNKFPGQRVNLVGGYGGLLIEPVVMPFSPVHLTFPVIIGAGGVAYVNYDWWNYDSQVDPSVWDSDAFFVLEPGVEIEINMVRFMRLAIGASYRYTSSLVMNNTNGNVLRGFSGGFSLKFGKF